MKNDNVERTVKTVGNMALMVKEWINDGTLKKDTIYGIGVLNEPAGQFEQIWTKVMETFYPLAYDTIRLVDPDFRVVIDSAFKSGDNFINYMSDKEHVVLDMHHYQGFGAYWNSMAIDFPDVWKNHYKHTCRVSS